MINKVAKTIPEIYMNLMYVRDEENLFLLLVKIAIAYNPHVIKDRALIEQFTWLENGKCVPFQVAIST